MAAEDSIIEPDVIEPDTTTNHGSTGPSPSSIANANGTANPFASPSDPIKRGTLDESVLTTLKRDVSEINSRLKQVVYPHFPTRTLLPTSEPGNSIESNVDISGHSDLWAPLTFIILYSLCVSHAKSLFSSIFVSCWFILLVMALHLRLTKPYDNISLISYISLSGYCLFPQVINAFLSQVILPLFLKANYNTWIIRVLTILKLLFLAVCLKWSVTAITLVTKCKDAVQIFPLGLCFLGFGWLSTML
ncbi:Yip4p NDAI_0B02750 [Naumovozyma dairenensis CBS 421]|uniref:Protein YIP n=1 Tax=Naumovozyma dairenensis (strain ATCC 10597 / BCRC 20456 / CBS 421 / NBRC 0211 / NRRL Y-12639) TaxID=1071378 RepID=G0W699_NAUDC|nr:hypothetical protein NDAI_0B02750 [Naumovozyma dairenensis CBS 421]CCD23310.1 hypothetical protein NDAI_0B02750 [Naumovozyma dairenensis CBS 421]